MSWSLDAVLSSTLLKTVRTSEKLEGPIPRSLSSTPLTAKELAALNADGKESVIQGKRIWQYEVEGLDTVRNVGVLHRGMGDMEMPVLERIHWGELSVGWGSRRLTLPLQSDFLVKSHFVNSGSVPEADKGLWVLPMSLQVSFQRVFGYEFCPSQQRIRPLSDPTLNNLMQPRSAASLGFFPGEWLDGRGIKLADAPLRLLVVVGLGCAGERKDFEPGGVLGAAKILPHFMVMANQTLGDITASLTLARPTETAHEEMDGERMTTALHSGLWTDSNDTRYNPVPELPFWHLLFDYFWDKPKINTHLHVVKREARQRDISGMLEVLRDEVAPGMGGSHYMGSTYRPRTVRKLERQGEFDNLHIAPRMLLPEALESKYPQEWPVQSIAMAPFCVHDCLHTHWRWGNFHYPLGLGSGASRWVKGWSRGKGTLVGQPHSETGAPMVPHNQDVWVQPLTPSSFRYKVRVHEPAAGDWQVLMHHGSGYAMSWTGAATLAQRVVNLGTGAEDWSNWALFYAALRYERIPVRSGLKDPDPSTTDAHARKLGFKFAERLKFNAKALETLRHK